MTPPFYIAKSFVTNIAFDVAESAQLSPNPVLPTETSLHVEIGTRNSENNMYHLVEVKLHISSCAEDSTPVYNLFLDYSAIVGTPDANPDNNDLINTLKVQVPKILLDNIRSIVYQVTRDAGFPFMMRDDTFDHPFQNTKVETEEPTRDFHDLIDEINQDIFDSTESDIIDFHWIINDMKSIEGGDYYLNLFTSYAGEETLSDYECLPIYKGYYRFFTPIEYHHPDFKECDKSIWPMLFQLLYGSFKAECRVIDRGDELPEIEFSYENYHDTPISDLDLEDLKELLSDLMTEALTETSVYLLGFQNTSDFSEEYLSNNRLMSKQDFLRLFNASVSDETVSLLDTMYERIKECDIQTVLYRP